MINDLDQSFLRIRNTFVDGTDIKFPKKGHGGLFWEFSCLISIFRNSLILKSNDYW